MPVSAIPKALLSLNAISFSPGPAFAVALVIVWGISSIRDLSFLTPCLQASVHAS